MSGVKVIRVGYLIDGKSAPIRNAVIVVEGDKIKDVGRESEVSISDGAKEVDASRYTAIPGLIDAHLHLGSNGEPDLLKTLIRTPPDLITLKSLLHAQALLQAGFTTVRDCGEHNFFAISLRMAIEQGYFQGPTILACGKMLSQTGGHGDFGIFNLGVCDGVDEVRKAARENLRAGADFIKVCASGGGGSPYDKMTDTQFTVDEIRAAVEEAKARGKRVAAHAMATQGIKNALLAGVYTIEHGCYLDDEGCSLMKERGAILVPTLTAAYQIVKHGVEGGIPEWSVKKTEEVVDAHVESVKKAHKAGVKIAAGSDAGTPFNVHGENALELALLVERCGFTTWEAIRAATLVAAEAVGLSDQVGTIEAGKYADIVIVDGNPLDDIKVLQDKSRIKLVMRRGLTVRSVDLV
ncbi:MAG: amidohydrolase family protein [Nitrososphaerales archaeon]